MALFSLKGATENLLYLGFSDLIAASRFGGINLLNRRNWGEIRIM